jgi:site-specific DNA-adenine methylase
MKNKTVFLWAGLTALMIYAVFVTLLYGDPPKFWVNHDIAEKIGIATAYKSCEQTKLMHALLNCDELRVTGMTSLSASDCTDCEQIYDTTVSSGKFPDYISISVSVSGTGTVRNTRILSPNL